MKILLLLFFIPGVMFAQGIEWPSLDAVKFVSGRVANETDVKNNAAIFVLKNEQGQYLGTPIDIKLPQYAIYTDSDSKQKSKVIVIQAESAQGMNMYGAIDISNGAGVISIDTDFKLLGSSAKE